VSHTTTEIMYGCYDTTPTLPWDSKTNLFLPIQFVKQM